MKKCCLTLALFSLTLTQINGQGPQNPPIEVARENSSSLNNGTKALAPFEAQDYSPLLGMKGFSDTALKLHFKLYEGYVKNTNTLLSELNDLLNSGKERSLDFAELKRRLMWEYDGMRLHEFYFENLSGGEVTKLKAGDSLHQAINSQFGSFEKWKNDFVATGLMRGIGWSVLYQDPATGRLINAWINEHDRGHLPGGSPILIMDVFEHAYMIDYGMDRAKYIEAFFNNIDWDIVSDRFAKATTKHHGI